MKKNWLIYTILMLAACTAACKKDFLERYPKTEIAPEYFFKTEKDLDLYVNGFYTDLPESEIYSDDSNSDNVEPGTIGDIVAGRTVVRTNASEAGWTWSSLRNINYFLERYHGAAAPDSVKAHYAGVARFFRALFYFRKLQRFGDVPWYSGTMGANSPELFKARDSRVLVVDSILADLDTAAIRIKAGKSVSRITRWAALALKSRVCLYEATYRIYHTELSLPGAEQLLQKAVAASQAIMQSGLYKLYSTGNTATDYLNLFAAENASVDEYILARVYDRGLTKTHPANGTFITATLGAPGLTKGFMDTYLMKDGSRFSALPGYGTMPFWEEVKDRDPRMAQTIRTPGYKRIGTTAALVPDYTNAFTGYQCIKFVTGTDQDGYNTNSNDLPIFRFAEVLLNYAEAKAELKDFTQADADRSVNLLRARAGVAPMNVSTLAVDPLLQQQYLLADPAILEVRRERRVELVMEGFRYQDVMRWKRGPLLAEDFKGAYFPGLGDYDLDQDGKTDLSIVDAKPSVPVKGIQYFVMKPDRAFSGGDKGNIIPHPNAGKKFEDPKHYLFPLPLTELLLNNNLKQNKFWDQ